MRMVMKKDMKKVEEKEMEEMKEREKESSLGSIPIDAHGPMKRWTSTTTTCSWWPNSSEVVHGDGGDLHRNLRLMEPRNPEGGPSMWEMQVAGWEPGEMDVDETHAHTWEHILSLNEPTGAEGGPAGAEGQGGQDGDPAGNWTRTRTCTWRT